MSWPHSAAAFGCLLVLDRAGPVAHRHRSTLKSLLSGSSGEASLLSFLSLYRAIQNFFFLKIPIFLEVVAAQIKPLDCVPDTACSRVNRIYMVYLVCYQFEPNQILVMLPIFDNVNKNLVTPTKFNVTYEQSKSEEIVHQNLDNAKIQLDHNPNNTHFAQFQLYLSFYCNKF